ncbi:MAG: hypothetical protein V7642_6027 [Burkholderiales bacterium]
MDLTYAPGKARTDNAAKRESPVARGAVVVYAGKAHRPNGHESVTQHELAKKLAALKGYDFAGGFDAESRYDCHVYFVPGDTLVALDHAHSLGIHGEQDLFGGVVPFPFVATKTITHPLPAADSRAPDGWNSGFASAVRDVVLPGFSAFTAEDVHNAGMRLLQDGGAVRLKKASGIGGWGQTVVKDAGELEAEIASCDVEELLRDGLVVEQNLEHVVTHSVGQVLVGSLLTTYYGLQRLTRNNHGNEVYGGSSLVIARGGFSELLALDLAPEVRLAITQARTYHAAAMASYPGMFASRCNYDIAQGIDGAGRSYSGVLEQSWRIGGASGAEIAALEAFQSDPALRRVCASTTEIYGENPSVPGDAAIYYQAVDELIGPLTKFSRLEEYANP